MNSFKSSLTFHIISSALPVESGIAFEYTQEHHNAGGHPSFSSSEELSMACDCFLAVFLEDQLCSLQCFNNC